ncbi:MAG: hypothetical protein ABFC73_12360 [Clostridiaceae bacterium]
MKPLRLTILVSLILCIISLIVSSAIASKCSAFIDEWFAYLISLTVGIFSSALLVCVCSLISLKDKRRGVAYSYYPHFYQIKQNLEYLSLYLDQQQTATGIVSISKSSDQIMIETLSSLASELSEVCNIERITPMTRDRYEKRKNHIKKNRLAYVEHNYKTQCVKAFLRCTRVLNELKRIPLYRKGENIEEAKQIITKNWNLFVALMEETGDYCVSCDKFEEKLDDVTGRNLSSIEV